MSDGRTRQVALTITTGDPETVNDGAARVESQAGGWVGQLGGYVNLKQPSGVGVGAAGVESYREKEYRYIRVDSAVTVAPYRGAIAWWYNKARFLVTTSPTNRRGAIAGVFQNAVTPGNYGFVQTAGPGTTKLIDAPTASPAVVGVFVIPSATAAKADALAAGSAATYPVLGLTSGTWDPVTCEAVVELSIADLP